MKTCFSALIILITLAGCAAPGADGAAEPAAETETEHYVPLGSHIVRKSRDPAAKTKVMSGEQARDTMSTTPSYDPSSGR